MRIPPFIPDEEKRLAALAEYGAEIGTVDSDLQSIVHLASNLFEAPIVLVSLVEQTRQIFAASVGLDACETGRDVSFCAHAIGQLGVLVVLDATLDPRFCDNPLVKGKPLIRFYAGTPLLSPTGCPIGTLCVIDTIARNRFSESDRRNLENLAALVLDKLELRRLDHARRTGQMRFEQIAATSPDGIICTDQDGVITFWNQAASRLLGYAAEEILGKSVDVVLCNQMRIFLASDAIPDSGKTNSNWNGRTIEHPVRHKNGSESLTEISVSMWREGDAANFGFIVRATTERRSSEDHLYRQAHLDELTELPNRSVMQSRIAEGALSSTSMSVIVLDLDGFKNVNDTLGHSSGDLLLRQVAARLLYCVSPTATVSRMGGDEFALLLPNIGDASIAGSIADEAIQRISAPFLLHGQRVNLGASAGVASWPSNSGSVNELLSNADLALHQAKAEGRHCRRIFAQSLRSAALHKRAYEGELERAYERSEFELYYQPQVRLYDGALMGAEALIRWRHPSKGILSPADFLPSLEAGFFAAEVGAWVIEQACTQTARWRKTANRAFRIGVNLFGAQFRAGDLATNVRAILSATHLVPSALELEITENTILRHDEAMIGPLRDLCAEGVGITFDDYGTGYASLSLLKRYPLTRLKIDRSFIQGMCESPEDASIVRAILHLGRGFGLAVIAEGVETAEQHDRLRKKGCEEAQGYLFGRPMTAAAFETKFGLNATPDFAHELQTTEDIVRLESELSASTSTR